MGSPKYQNDGDAATSGPGFGITMHETALELPLRWRAPRTVFVDSMSDLFHPGVTEEFIARVFAVMAATPQHTYQVLTKRSRRLAQLALELPWPSNVWIGTSIESDRYSYRAVHLRTVEAAAVRFLSLEPLLEPLRSLDLTGVDWVIVGGESGRGHRPIDVSWVRDLRDRCVDAGVAFFFKQHGGRTPKSGGRDLDGRTWDEMPVARTQEQIGA